MPVPVQRSAYRNATSLSSADEILAGGPGVVCSSCWCREQERRIRGNAHAGVEFTAVDNPHANKLTVHILAAVAQHERRSQRPHRSGPQVVTCASGRGPRAGQTVFWRRDHQSSYCSRRPWNQVRCSQVAFLGGTEPRAACEAALLAGFGPQHIALDRSARPLRRPTAANSPIVQSAKASSRYFDELEWAKLEAPLQRN